MDLIRDAYETSSEYASETDSYERQFYVCFLAHAVRQLYDHLNAAFSGLIGG
jgi:hypothetical protein